MITGYRVYCKSLACAHEQRLYDGIYFSAEFKWCAIFMWWSHARRLHTAGIEKYEQ